MGKVLSQIVYKNYKFRLEFVLPFVYCFAYILLTLIFVKYKLWNNVMAVWTL